MKFIPNFFTLLNLFFGCTAIVFILQNGIMITYTEEGTSFLSVSEQLWMASLFIGLAAVVDFLDGFIARLFKATSEMGKQLDSLADVVSFGVAPGMILYQFLRMSFMREEQVMDTSIISLLPAFILPCAAAYRLAKFNLDSTQQYGFKGVPTPAVGLLVASLPLIYWHYQSEETLMNILLNKWLIYALILLLSYLMVSNISIMSLKFRDYTLKGNMDKILLVIISIILVIFLQWLAVPFIFLAYIIISLSTSKRKSEKL